MTTIGRLNYQIKADSSSFTSGIRLTRSELTQARRIMRDSRTPAQRYGESVTRLNRQFAAGKIDAAAYQKRLADLRAEYVRTGTAIGRVRGALANSRVATYASGAAIAGLGLALRSVVNISEEFAQAMASSTAIMGDVNQQIRSDMEATAKQVAYQTKFSATEAAEAYYFLASAGMTAQQSIEALPAVATFAQAGMFDLALATDLLTDAQSALGLTSKNTAENLVNMTRVSDVLVKGATLANASVQQFSESLTNKAGAAARQVGKEVEETVAVLAAFADQGIKGAEAGTGFGIIMRDLQTKALENAEAFKAAGVAVFDQAGEMRNLADIVADLENRLDGMSDAQAKAALLQLGFSDKSVAFVQTLIGTSEKIRGYEDSLRDAGGTTAEVAEKQLPPLTASLNQLKAVWEAFSIEIGTPLAAGLAGATDEAGGLAKILATVADVAHFFVLAWKFARVAMELSLHPLQTMKGLLARLALQWFDFLDAVVASAPEPLRKMFDASALRGQLDRLKAMAAEGAKDTADHFGKVKTLQDEAMAAFLDDTPGQKFLATIQQMKQPLDAAAAATGDVAAAEQQAFNQENVDRVLAYSEAIDQLETRLAEQIATFGMSSREAEIWRLAQQGASDAALENVRSMTQQLARMEELEQAFGDGKKLTEQFETPMERFARRIEELARLYRVGAISAKVFERAQQSELAATMEQIAAKEKLANANQAILKGSAEAIAMEETRKRAAFAESELARDRERLGRVASSVTAKVLSDPSAGRPDSRNEKREDAKLAALKAIAKNTAGRRDAAAVEEVDF